jgi:chromatin assembly factor 1 subunit A
LSLVNILTDHITCYSVKPKKNKSIAMYFSKRCLPPEEAVNALAASPELRLKSRNGGREAPQINLFPSEQ